MQDLIVRVSKAPFNYPDKVLVKAIDGHNTCVLEFRVAKKDIDKIIRTRRQERSFDWKD
jgi:predicted RNA-binding protein YlqC (UPF0109 family)